MLHLVNEFNRIHQLCLKAAGKKKKKINRVWAPEDRLCLNTAVINNVISHAWYVITKNPELGRFYL